MNFVLTLTTILLLGSGGLIAVEPTVQCPAPLSPQNGQVFLTKDGSVVKYTCGKGFKLLGPDGAICNDGTWEPEPPVCLEESDDVLSDKMMDEDQQTTTTTQTPPTTQRPLFKWDDGKDEVVKSPDEEMQSDEARLQMLLYPDRRHFVHLQQREGKGSKSSPSTIYVRRGSPGLGLIRATLRDSKDDVALVDGSTNKEKEDEMPQSDERWRYLHWLNQAGYHYPASYAYSASGHPVVMTLDQSQLAWINSLHPELRDKYLKDIYKTRAHEFSEELRAQYLYGHYGDAYDPYRYWYYHDPYYYSRQPVSALVEDPISSYDYSCHEVDDSGRAHLIRAPQLRNGFVYRYDRRRNPNYPSNNYLAVEYRCNPGHKLLDSRINEMYCSRKGWVGRYPACVPQRQ